MVKIWGRITSLNVRKVVLAAQWLQIPFERIDAGREFGVVNTPSFRALNFNALVPVLEDGALCLWESNVIVRYLCASHATGTLYPEKLADRFEAERWMDWQQTTLNPAGRDAFIQLIRTPPEARNPALIARSAAATETLFAQLDAHLATQRFIAAEHFTMADIPIACEVHRFRGLPLPHEARPHLDRWYQGILAHPAAQGVFDVPLS